MPQQAPVLQEPSFQSASSQIIYCPEPEWSVPLDYDPDFPRKDGEPITQILVDQQIDAVTHCTFSRSVQRLENMQAVQNLAQWCLDFDPGTQQLQLHHLRILRDGTSREYAKAENVRFLQREESLESFILLGHVTLLVLLEDIRPGDILEASFSRISRPHLLPDALSAFQIMRNPLQIGYYNFSVRFPSGRVVRWLTGDPEDAPKIETNDGHTRWTWTKKNLPRTQTEEFSPPWNLPALWIEVSDTPGWSEISNAAAKLWPTGEGSETLDAEVARIRAQADSPEERIESAIQYVQDEFRYLSVNLEVGGQIPSAPDLVLKRRYGDCKDLSLLLSCLLTKLGISARPILVNESLGKNLPDLLPSDLLFNHVVVEYRHEENTYWVDATIPHQGGGVRDRVVPEYHFGLPVQSEPTELIPQPAPKRDRDRLVVHDTLMLDTAGNPTLLRVQTLAHGQHADHFRHQLANEGIAGFAEWSKTRHNHRYNTSDSTDASDLDAPQYEDNRAENVWRMVELYRLPPLQNTSSQAKTITLPLPLSLPITAIPVPDETERKTPFSIPNRVSLTHVVEIRSRACKRRPKKLKNFKAHGLEFKMETLFFTNKWTHTTSLISEADAVPVETVQDFRKMMLDVQNQYSWMVAFPKGVIRMHREQNFFVLPKKEKRVGAETPGPRTTEESQIPTITPPSQRIASHPDLAVQEKSSPRKTRRQKPLDNNTPLKSLADNAEQKPEVRSSKTNFWMTVLTVIAIGLAMLGYLIYAAR